MNERPDDLEDEETGLPQPGTPETGGGEEPAEGEETEGPGNVSVDEPTAPALAPKEIDEESPG